MNNLISFSTFLNESKVSLKDIEEVINDPWFNKFKAGFECEFLLPNSNKDLSFEKIAEMFKEYSGDSQVTFATKYHDDTKKITSKEGQLYTHFEPDITILQPDTTHPESDNYYAKDMLDHEKKGMFAIELASKTLNSISEFLEYLDMTFKFISHYHGITNTSTGFHFTISGFPLDTPWFRVAYLTGTNSVLKQFGRAENENAKSQLNNYTIDQDQIVKALKNKTPLKTIIDSQKFTSEKKFDIHLKGKLMEFRSIGNWWYHQKFKEIKEVFLRMLWAIKKANTTNPQDFAKTEVRKILVPNKPKNHEDNFDQFLDYHIKSNFENITKTDQLDNRNKLIEYFIENINNKKKDNKIFPKFIEWIYVNLDRTKNLIKALILYNSKNKDSNISKIISDLKIITQQNIYKSNSFNSLIARQNQLKTSELTSLDKRMIKIAL